MGRIIDWKSGIAITNQGSFKGVFVVAIAKQTRLQPTLQTGLNKLIQIAIQNRLGIARFHAGA